MGLLPDSLALRGEPGLAAPLGTALGRHWGTPWDRGCVLTPHSFLSAPWGWRSCTGCRAGLLPGLESPPPHDPVLRVQEGSELSSGPQGGVPQPLLASRGGTLPSWEGVGQDWVWGERAPPAMRPRWSTALGTGVVSGPGPLEIAPVPLRTPVFVCDLDPQRARKVGVLSSPAGPPVRAGGRGSSWRQRPSRSRAACPGNASTSIVTPLSSARTPSRP